MGFFCYCGTAFGGGQSCGVMAILKIAEICFRAAVCLLPRFLSGISGVGFSNECVRSMAVRVAASSEDILGNERFYGKNSVVPETDFLDLLGM